MAASITQLTLCQVSTEEIDTATKLGYEVSQAQKALLLMPRTAKGASTSSEELNAQVSLPTDDGEPTHEDQLQEH